MRKKKILPVFQCPNKLIRPIKLRITYSLHLVSNSSYLTKYDIADNLDTQSIITETFSFKCHVTDHFLHRYFRF